MRRSAEAWITSLGMVTSLGLVSELWAAPLGTAITYQGNLQNSSGPVTDTCNFRFTMWDASAAGNQVGPTLTFDGAGANPPAVTVANGLFSVPLDFGAGTIIGEARWLRIEVICQNDPNYPTYALLSPRVELKPTPHALALPGLYTLQNSTCPNLIGGYAGNTVSAGVVGATIGGGGDANSPFPNSVTANFGTIGGGYNNTSSGSEATIGGGVSNVASGALSTVGGGHSGVAGGPHSTVGGGFSCRAIGQGSTVGGGRGNLSTQPWATVGGGDNNQASGAESTIAGGLNSQASGSQATVGGGGFNTAGGQSSTVGGGNFNMASGQDSAVGGGFGCRAMGQGSTVGGGQGNTAANTWSTVGGGTNNQAVGSQSTVGGGSGCGAVGTSAIVGGGNGNVAGGDWSTIGGGDINQASGFWSTVGGGSSNQAGGYYSFAAGRRAKVRDATQVGAGDTDGDEGTFIWADSTNADFQSTGPNQFLVRASGGVGINTNAPTATLHIGGTAGVDGIRFPDGTLQTTAAAGGGNTLDQAYDQGGAGAGRTITADAGAVNIAGPNGLTVNGNVSIGTIASLAPLQVHGSGDSILRVSSSTSVGGIHITSGGTFANGWTIRSNGGAPGNLEFRDVVQSLTRMTMQTDGRVGIGTTGVVAHPLQVGTNVFNGNGAHLTAGGVWTNGSDRNSKHNFENLDKQEILERVAQLPVTRWQYKGEPEIVRHIGPVAQDFYAAFGTGADERYIGTIDADGVALAAIQGLYEVVKDKECQIEALREQKDRDIQELREQNHRDIGELNDQNTLLRFKNAELESRLERLEALVTASIQKGEGE